MASPQTGKQRAARISLDYYRQSDRFTRGKLLLSLLIGGMAIAWAAWGLLHGATQHSPGPLAAVHAPWEANCQACHTPLVALRGDAWQISADVKSQIDAKCQKCHRTPQHHATQLTSEIEQCSTCHHEHQGRSARLNRTADQTCVACHADLPRHTTKPEVLLTSGAFNNAQVTRFTADSHPEFRSAQRDPGQLKFSHRRHLAPGLNWGAQDRSKPLRLADLPSGERDRYRTPGASDDDVIQLNCSSCHQLASPTPRRAGFEGFISPLASKRSAGAYMAPVSFNQHCRACHPLSFAPTTGTPVDASTTIEHALPSEKLLAHLESTLAKRFLDNHPTVDDRVTPAVREIPGKQPRATRADGASFVATQLATAETFLRGRCNQCHVLDDVPTRARVAPVRVPQRWYQHARFDHSAHRATRCEECHAPSGQGAVNYLATTWKPGEREPTLDHHDLLIPQRSVCLQCHNDRPPQGLRGGARFDCVECHDYHGGDHGTQRPALDIKPVQLGDPALHDWYERWTRTTTERTELETLVGR